MEQRKRRYAALYMVIRLTDEHNGELIVNNGKVRRVFNDADDVVRVELANGEIQLAADQDFDTLDAIARANI